MLEFRTEVGSERAERSAGSGLFDSAMYVINTLAPVFLVIALGAALRRVGFLSLDLQRDSRISDSRLRARR